MDRNYENLNKSEIKLLNFSIISHFLFSEQHQHLNLPTENVLQKKKKKKNRLFNAKFH